MGKPDPIQFKIATLEAQQYLNLSREVFKEESSTDESEPQPQDLAQFRADEDRKWLQMYQSALNKKEKGLRKTLSSPEQELTSQTVAQNETKNAERRNPRELLNNILVWQSFLNYAIRSESKIISFKTKEYNDLITRYSKGHSKVKRSRNEIMELHKGQFVYQMSLVTNELNRPDELWRAEEIKEWQAQNNPDLLFKFQQLRHKYRHQLANIGTDSDHPTSTSFRNHIKVLNAIIEGLKKEEQKTNSEE